MTDMQQLFEKLQASRGRALLLTAAGTLLFVLASASRQAADGSLLLEIFSGVLMLLGVAGQFIGLTALLKKPRR